MNLNSKFIYIIIVVLIVILVILSISNPSKNTFVDYCISELTIVSNTDANNSSNLVNNIRDIFLNKTYRQSFIVCSVFKTEVAGSIYKTVGIFGSFYSNHPIPFNSLTYDPQRLIELEESLKVNWQQFAFLEQRKRQCVSKILNNEIWSKNNLNRNYLENLKEIPSVCTESEIFDTLKFNLFIQDQYKFDKVIDSLQSLLNVIQMLDPAERDRLIRVKMTGKSG